VRRCVWSRNIKNRRSIHIYIYDISSLRVNIQDLFVLKESVIRAVYAHGIPKNLAQAARNQTDYFIIIILYFLLFNFYSVWRNIYSSIDCLYLNVKASDLYSVSAQFEYWWGQQYPEWGFSKLFFISLGHLQITIV